MLTAPLREHTATIVAAYLRNNPLPADQLGPFIESIHQALAEAAATPADLETDRPEIEPPLPIEDSYGPDYMVCLDCGTTMLRLQRHIALAHNLTPDQYRERWGLPDSYPMNAPLSLLRSRQFAGRPRKNRVLQ